MSASDEPCEQCDDYEEEIESLKKDKRKLERTILSLKTKNQELGNDVSFLTKEQEDETREKEVLKLENKALRTKMKKQAHEIRLLREEREEVEGESRSAHAEKRELELEIQTLKDENQSLQKKNKGLEEEARRKGLLLSRKADLMEFLMNGMKKLDAFFKSEISNYPCRERRCITCSYINPVAKFYSHSGEEYNVTRPISCQTTNLVYLIKCTKCNQQYVGETGMTLNKRMIKHRSDINLESTSCGVAEHFCRPGHSVEEHLRVMGIEAGFEDTAHRKEREKHWRGTLDTLKNGMNKKN